MEPSSSPDQTHCPLETAAMRRKYRNQGPKYTKTGDSCARGENLRDSSRMHIDKQHSNGHANPKTFIAEDHSFNDRLRSE